MGDQKISKKNTPSTSSSEDESSEEDIEMLATSRARRGNAGNKMASLLDKEDDSNVDDFYKTTYGGFFDETEDHGFDSPVDSEPDVVDSDFDADEDEGGEDGDGKDDATDKPARKKRRGIVTKAYKEPSRDGPKTKRKIVREQPKKSGAGSSHPIQRCIRERRSGTIAQRRPTATISSSVTKLRSKQQRKEAASSPRRAGKAYRVLSQEQLLEEAKQTEISNLNSLQKFRELEFKAKSKAAKNKKAKKSNTDENMVKQISTSIDRNGGKECVNMVVFPSTLDLPKFHGSGERIWRRCVVTGEPAKYVDPFTGLPFLNKEAFNCIRQAYDLYLAGE